MRKAAVLFLLLTLFGCTAYDGTAYIKKDLDAMKCSRNSTQPNIDMESARTDCMNYTVNPEAVEYLRTGVSIATIDWIKEVHRRTYQECMDGKGFVCDWEREPGKK